MNGRYNCRGSIILLLACSVFVAGCGGTKILKEAQPLQTTQALATASDQQISATLDWVVVRDGPGTWARNADWDEYLLRVRNLSDEPVQIKRLTVVDSLDSRLEPQTGRKQLVKESKRTAKRYKKTGVKVKAGRGAGTMLAAGAAVTIIGVGAAGAVATGAVLSGAAAGASAGAAVGGLLLLGPALAIGGVVRGVNNRAVSREIEHRQTVLPIELAIDAELNLDIFFPLAPSPGKLEVIYANSNGEHLLVIDTSTALHGLHIEAATK